VNNIFIQFFSCSKQTVIHHFPAHKKCWSDKKKDKYKLQFLLNNESNLGDLLVYIFLDRFLEVRDCIRDLSSNQRFVPRIRFPVDALGMGSMFRILRNRSYRDASNVFHLQRVQRYNTIKKYIMH